MQELILVVKWINQLALLAFVIVKSGRAPLKFDNIPLLCVASLPEKNSKHRRLIAASLGSAPQSGHPPPRTPFFLSRNPAAQEMCCA
jgi:hypothetical protein